MVLYFINNDFILNKGYTKFDNMLRSLFTVSHFTNTSGWSAITYIVFYKFFVNIFSSGDRWISFLQLFIL